MIAALYSSRIGGTKQFYKNGVYIGWETIEDLDLQRAKDGLSRRVPQLKYSHVVRDSWTRLNVLPAKIMQVNKTLPVFLYIIIYKVNNNYNCRCYAFRM